MKSETNTNLIKEILNDSLAQLAPATLEKLRSARSHAVEHQRTQSSVPVLAWLGHHSARHDSFNMSKPLNWAVAALLLAFLVSGASYWHSYTSEHEISEVDIAILTDDLPIHIYLD